MEPSRICPCDGGVIESAANAVSTLIGEPGATCSTTDHLDKHVDYGEFASSRSFSTTWSRLSVPVIRSRLKVPRAIRLWLPVAIAMATTGAAQELPVDGAEDGAGTTADAVRTP